MPETNKEDRKGAFKLAKVGERRRKGAGFTWFGGGGASGGAASSGGGLAGLLSGNLLPLVITAAVAIGGYVIGNIVDPAGPQPAKKAKVFAGAEVEKKADYGEVKGLPSEGRGRSSLGMISGSLDGKTPEQRAAEAAAAEAAAKAEAEKQAQAEAAANKEAGAVPGAATDPAAIAAAAAAGAPGAEKGAMGQRIGALSKGFGSGTSLSGGGGMAGGIGQGFAPKVASSSGKLAAFGRAGTVGRTGAQKAQLGQNKGLAGRQLRSAALLGNQSRSGTSENRTSYASAGFDNNPGAGEAITGAGAGEGGNPGKDKPGVNVVGGPIGGSGSDGGGYTTDKNKCSVALIKEGYITNDAGDCVKDDSGKDVTPWQKTIDNAVKWLAVGTGLMLLAWGLSQAAKALGPTGYGYAALQAAAMIAAIAAAAAFAVVIGLGIHLIDKYKQTGQGLIFILTGGLGCAAAIQAAMGKGKAYSPTKLAKAAAAAVILQMGTALIPKSK